MFISALIVCLLSPAATPDTAVVCPAELQTALAPWLEFRRAQGHEITLLASDGSAEDIRARIRQVGKLGTLKFVVLVGSAKPDQWLSPLTRVNRVPPHYATAKVNIRFGSEAEIATDHWYADLDDDDVPDVAIGRLAASNAVQLGAIVQKILAYERDQNFEPWRTRVNFVAGSGDFGPAIDTALETAARHFISSSIPAGYNTSMTQLNWRSPYCPDPRLIQQTTQQRLNEGCLFWVYMGHASPFALAPAKMPDGEYPTLKTDDLRQLNCVHGAPIALMLACYAGAMDARYKCLAEEMLQAPGGPVAAIAGSRVTMPYGMSVFGNELLDACFVQHQPTVGELVLNAKRNLIRHDKRSSNSVLLDLTASALSPSGVNLNDERHEHAQLFNLLGDPLLAMRYPRDVKLELVGEANGGKISAGQTLEITGKCSVDGVASVELVVKRDRLTFEPPKRAKYDSAATTLDAYRQTYLQANDSRMAHSRCNCGNGQFRTTMVVPAGAVGTCHVRVYVEGREDFAQGSVDIDIRPAATANLPVATDGQLRR